MYVSILWQFDFTEMSRRVAESRREKCSGSYVVGTARTVDRNGMFLQIFRQTPIPNITSLIDSTSCPEIVRDNMVLLSEDLTIDKGL